MADYPKSEHFQFNHILVNLNSMGNMCARSLLNLSSGGDTMHCIVEERNNLNLFSRIQGLELFAQEARYHPKWQKVYTRDLHI